MKLSACRSFFCLSGPLALSTLLVAQAAKPAITLDEFLNTTEIVGARLSPDGTAAVIGTENPDWKANTFRHTLSLWTAKDGLRALTQSGSDEDAQWSPDGKWIAFLSDRPLGGGDDGATKDSSDSGSGDSKARRAGASDDDKTTRLWLIPVAGGEAQPLYREKLDAHTFAWSPDSKTIYLSTTTPLTHAQEDAQKDDWKDVIRWREQERPELLLALPVAVSLANTAAQQQPHPPKEDKTKQDETKLTLPAGAQNLATLKLEIAEIAPAPDGKTVAFLTTAISHRMENPGDTEIFLLPATGGEPHQLTHNLALEAGLRWTSDSHWGLTGMRERAQAIRAEFNIWSREGAGTEVELVIPASISYPRKQKSAAKQQVVSQ